MKRFSFVCFTPRYKLFFLPLAEQGVAFDAIKITDSVLPEETAVFLRHVEDSAENMLFVIPAGHPAYAVK